MFKNFELWHCLRNDAVASLPLPYWVSARLLSSLLSTWWGPQLLCLGGPISSNCNSEQPSLSLFLLSDIIVTIMKNSNSTRNTAPRSGTADIISLTVGFTGSGSIWKGLECWWSPYISAQFIIAVGVWRTRMLVESGGPEFMMFQKETKISSGPGLQVPPVTFWWRICLIIPCPENMSEAEYRSNGLMCLVNFENSEQYRPIVRKSKTHCRKLRKMWSWWGKDWERVDFVRSQGRFGSPVNVREVTDNWRETTWSTLG